MFLEYVSWKSLCRSNSNVIVIRSSGYQLIFEFTFQ